MFSAQRNQILTRATHERGTVECGKCRTRIFVNRPQTVSIEFCVPCPKCGHRGIYFKRMISIEGEPDRRRHPRD